jgi:nicotinamidase-related amidase
MTIPEALNVGNTALVLIDYQERLFSAMHEKEALLDNVLKLVKGVNALGVPVLLTEQYPKGLGPTLPQIKELLPQVIPLEKTCFDSCDEENFSAALKASGRKQVLLAGIEAHICVYQTAMSLARSGYQVQVVSDCCSSRSPPNKKIALFRMGAARIIPTTDETALFELLKVGRGDVFKQISYIIK